MRYELIAVMGTLKWREIEMRDWDEICGTQVYKMRKENVQHNRPSLQ